MTGPDEIEGEVVGTFVSRAEKDRYRVSMVMIDNEEGSRDTIPSRFRLSGRQAHSEGQCVYDGQSLF